MNVLSPPQSAHLPQIESKDLDGRILHLPAELPGERTIVLVAFERKQQSNVDTWTKGLRLAGNSLPWLELPVIDDPGALARWFIVIGMRRGIKEHALWHHVVTLYTDKEALKAALGIVSEKEVYAMVLDREGLVLSQVAGDCTEAGAAQILEALGVRRK